MSKNLTPEQEEAKKARRAAKNAKWEAESAAMLARGKELPATGKLNPKAITAMGDYDLEALTMRLSNERAALKSAQLFVKEQLDLRALHRELEKMGPEKLEALNRAAAVIKPAPIESGEKLGAPDAR